MEKPLFLAIIIGGLTTIGYTVPLGFWWLLLMRIIWGSCWSVLRAEGYTNALTLSKEHNRGKILAIYQTITRVGSGGGVLVGGFLADIIGIPKTFMIYGLITLTGLIPFYIALSGKDFPKDKENEPFRKSWDEDKTRTAGSSGIKTFLKNNSLIWYGAFAITMTEQMITNLTGRLVVDRIIPGSALAIGAASMTGVLLGFRTFSTLAIVPLMGVLNDKLGRKRVMLYTLFIEIIILTLFPLSSNWLVLCIILSVQFMTAVSARLGIYVLAGDRAALNNNRGDQALYMNRFATFVDIGTSIGPIVAYSLYSTVGFNFVILLGISVLTPLTYLILKKQIR
ncbi:MAG: MFS transporter [Spirochaetales bacterium]|nr:MFS transporter [Spirochaetales bacterium]